MTPKFKVGDLVRCLNPSHPGKNPFVLDRIVAGLYYDADRPTIPIQIHCQSGNWNVGCRECDLELVKEAHEAH